MLAERAEEAVDAHFEVAVARIEQDDAVAAEAFDAARAEEPGSRVIARTVDRSAGTAEIRRHLSMMITGSTGTAPGTEIEYL